MNLSFSQILELVRNLSGEQKIKISRELEKETIGSKLTELLTAFRTDKLSMNEITSEVEQVRQDLYDARIVYLARQSHGTGQIVKADTQSVEAIDR